MTTQRITAILQRAKRLTDQKIAARKRLAYHYAAKAGYPKADGYIFHCLHNWTIGNGPEAGNAFAHKAVDAWARIYDGTDQFIRNVYHLAIDRGIE